MVTGSCNKKQWQLFASHASLLCCCRAFLSSCGFTIWPGESFLRFVAQLTRGESRGRAGFEMLTTTLTFAVRVALSFSLYLYLYLCILWSLPSWNYLSAKATRRVNGKHSRCRVGEGKG